MFWASRGAVRCPTASTMRCHHALGAVQRRIDVPWDETAPGMRRSLRTFGRNREAAAPTTATVAATTRNTMRAIVTEESMSLHLQLRDLPDHRESHDFEEDPRENQLRSLR